MTAAMRMILITPAPDRRLRYARDEWPGIDSGGVPAAAYFEDLVDHRRCRRPQRRHLESAASAKTLRANRTGSEGIGNFGGVAFSRVSRRGGGIVPHGAAA